MSRPNPSDSPQNREVIDLTRTLPPLRSLMSRLPPSTMRPPTIRAQSVYLVPASASSSRVPSIRSSSVNPRGPYPRVLLTPETRRRIQAQLVDDDTPEEIKPRAVPYYSLLLDKSWDASFVSCD